MEKKMEENNQSQKTEITKSKNKNSQKSKSKRAPKSFKSAANELLNEANKKSFGRKIKAYEILSLGISLIRPEHIKILQEQSLTNEDRQELLRQKYIKLNGPISKRDYVGFTMTPEYVEFLKLHFLEIKNHLVA